MPAAANGAAGTDGELIVIDGDVAYNFWQFKRTSTTTASAASFGQENIVTGDGWGSKSPFLSAGITAAGASQLGGLIVGDEVKDGSIDHALQLAVDFGLAKPGAVGQAISSDGSSSSGIVQEGQHLAIPPGTPMPAGLSPLGQQVFKAMQQYGAYVIDVAGGTTNVRAQANAFDDATMTALWHDMGNITPLLQAVSGGTSSGGTGGSSGGTGTTPPVITPPVVTDPPTTTNPPTGTSPSQDTTAPTVQWVAANGPGVTNGTGTVRAGDTVTLTLKFSEAVNVSGTPTLSLNDNGTAKYVSGAGSDTLQFEYKVAAGENTADLAIKTYNLSGVKDLAGNAFNVSGAPYQPAGTLVVDTKTAAADTIAPKVQWVAANGPGLTNGTGTVRAGDTVTLTLKFSEAVTVNGTPTLSLNDKGTAKYVSGAGSDTLQFEYKVAAGENTSDLAIKTYNLSGVKDLAGNAFNVSGAPYQPAGTLVVDTKTAAVGTTTVQWVAATGSKLQNGTGTVSAGDTVRLSVNFSQVMTVNGTPTLSLNSNGTAKYVGGAGTNTLQFDYKVQAGEKASDLEISGYNLNGVKDRAGNAVNVSGAPHQPAGTLAVRGTSAANTAVSQPTTLAMAADIAAPASATTSVDPAAASQSTSNNWFGGRQSGGSDFSFGNRTTVAYPGANDGSVGVSAAQGTAMSRLALLDQYAASSFATPASTTGGPLQGWLNNTAQTLAKPQA